MTADQDLVADALRTFAPLSAACRQKANTVLVDIHRSDGSVLWPDYASGHSRILAILAAEQRYLVEQIGHGSVPGATYAEKAAERLRRHHRPR